MNPDFWRDRRVFLTGHTGFKGSWLSIWLRMLQARVTGFALPPHTEPSLHYVARSWDGLESVTGDVRDGAVLSDALRRAQPEVVIHLAAQSLVRESYRRPVETFATNVIGTVNLLEAVRYAESVRAVVIVTSDKCYRLVEPARPYRESDPMGGVDPYSSSKGCAELATSAYRASFSGTERRGSSRAAVATARAGNVLGGGDWAKDRLVPDVLAAFERGEAVRIRNPRAVRPWQHVLEPLRGYLVLAERLFEQGDAFAEPWNFGPEEQDAKPVAWLVERLARLWGNDARWEFDAREHPHEAAHLSLDISKARASLEWAPRLGLDTALEMVVDWTRALQRGSDMANFTVSQIRGYEKLLSIR